MATIKAYTDLEQSKKLADILPIESADMYYCYGMDIHTKKWDYDIVPTIIDTSNQIDIGDIPCWSLAALLRLIPNFNMLKRTIECRIETPRHSIDKACDLVDAAFEMVCWLKENNKL